MLERVFFHLRAQRKREREREREKDDVVAYYELGGSEENDVCYWNWREEKVDAILFFLFFFFFTLCCCFCLVFLKHEVPWKRVEREAACEPSSILVVFFFFYEHEHEIIFFCFSAEAERRQRQRRHWGY